jgi:hypothetical protein
MAACPHADAIRHCTSMFGAKSWLSFMQLPNLDDLSFRRPAFSAQHGQTVFLVPPNRSFQGARPVYLHSLHGF